MALPQGIVVEIDGPNGDSVHVRVRGELDMSAAPELGEVLSGLSPDVLNVTLDLAGVTFLDSSAIRTLVSAGLERQEAGGTLRLGPCSDAVMRVLEITGLAASSDAFTVLPGGS